MRLILAILAALALVSFVGCAPPTPTLPAPPAPAQPRIDLVPEPPPPVFPSEPPASPRETTEEKPPLKSPARPGDDLESLLNRLDAAATGAEKVPLIQALGDTGRKEAAVAFPIAIGLALIGGVVLNYIIQPAGNAPLLFSGVFLVLLAIIVSASAHSAYRRVGAQQKLTPQLRTPLKRDLHKPTVSPFKGIALSLASGVLMAAFYPLVELSKSGDIELSLSPYTAAFCFAVGLLLTTPIYSIVFMKVPVQGEEVQFRDYLKLPKSAHLWGLLGGLVWTVGTICNFVASSAPSSVNVGPAISYALGQGATLISALWGLLVWREFKGAKPGVVWRLVIMLALYFVGLALISIAPLHGR